MVAGPVASQDGRGARGTVRGDRVCRGGLNAAQGGRRRQRAAEVGATRVAGSRIARLDPAITTVTYDLSRLTIMPGGIDTHVHLTSHFDANGRAHNDPGGAERLQQTVLYTEENAYQALMAGITTVQSIGS